MIKIGKPAAVRRVLFGEPDREFNKKFLEEQKQEMDRQQEALWNFDFVNEKPLRGRYIWERILPKNVIQLPESPCTKSDSEDDEDREGPQTAPSVEDVPCPVVKIVRPVPQKRKRDSNSQQSTLTGKFNFPTLLIFCCVWFFTPLYTKHVWTPGP